jgi:mannose-6-phosphate isomerase-like protein (cupin superfamily)
MAEYTVVKVSDVPDQSANLGHDPEQFEIRFLRNDLGCEHCGVSFARYRKGFASEAHTHNRQEEVYVLVSGRAQALVGANEVIDLEPWTALRVPA